VESESEIRYRRRVTAVFINNQHDIKRRGQDFDNKVCIWKGTQQRGWQTNFLRNLTKRGVNKLFKKLRDTGAVNRRPSMAERTVPALKKTLSFRSSRSLPLTLFWRLPGEVTKNTFLSVKKTKSVAYCLNFWSRNLARFMRAVQFASVSSCAQRLLKDFRCKSLQIIWNTDDRWISVSRDISRTVLWVCDLSSWLRTKSLTVSTFSSVWAQIDGKSKQAKGQWHGKSYLQSARRKSRYFKHWKYQNLWMNNRVWGDENMYSVCVFFHICRKFEVLVSQGSVATCLRWGG